MSDAAPAPSAAPEGGCLRGCVVYVTVTHSGGLSASVPFQNKCEALGAHVAKVMTQKVTHVVFRGEEAELSALHDRARKLSPESPPAFVTTLWVLACERDGRRPAERAYACPTPATTPRFGFFATPPGASRAASASSKRKARAMAPKSADAYDVDMEFFSSSQALKDEAEGLSRADSLKKRARANAAAARDAKTGHGPKDRRPGSDSKIAARARAAALASASASAAASAAAARPRPMTAGGGATRSSGGTLRTSRSLPRATTTTTATPSSAPAPKRARIARASAAAEAAAAASPVRPMRLPPDATDGRDENENENEKGGDVRGEVSGGGARGGSREATVAGLTRRPSANVGRAVLASGAPSISSKGRSSTRIVAVSRGGDETEAMVRGVARELGGFRAAGPTEHDRATHLVLAEPRRTMRLLRAVARGAWVVTPEWARASAARGAWADPAEFETDAFPGARRARMARERGEIGAGKGLLGGVRVHVEERASRPSAAELRALAAAAGGEIAPRGVDADVVVSSDGRGATAKGTGTETRGGARDVVTEAWLLKAVADYELPRLEDFRPR